MHWFAGIVAVWLTLAAAPGARGPAAVETPGAGPEREAAPSGADDAMEYPPGAVIERIACQTDPERTYAARIPSDGADGSPRPALFVMDPRGRALHALALFEAAAEHHGWIVVSSWDTLSDGPREPNELAMRAMLPDVQKRFRVDPLRIYLAGFSGTARVAWDFAVRIRGVAGIVGVGGGLPAGMDPPAAGDFVFFGSAGTTDFNYEEMRALDARLDETGIRHRVAYFDGPHDWCPPDRCAEAIAWLDLQAMRDGLRVKDEAFVEALFAGSMKRAADLEAAGELHPAWRVFRAAVEDFAPLRDVSAVRIEAERLGASKEVRRAERRAARFARDQARYEAALYDFLAEFGRSGPFRHARSLAQLQVRRILGRAADTDDPDAARAAQRIVELAFTNLSFYETRDYIARKDWDRAAAMLAIAAEFKPSHPRVCYGLARVRAQQGRTSEAIEALTCAIDSGGVTAPFIEADALLAPLRSVPAYRALLDRLNAGSAAE